MIRWRNISAKPTSELQFHLYWNAWRNADSTWLRERDDRQLHRAAAADGWGAIDVTLGPSSRALGLDRAISRRTCTSSRPTMATRATAQ